MANIGIVGSGIAGMGAALQLARGKHKITLFDKYNPTSLNTSSGLTFNYTINFRGRSILKDFGIINEIEENAVWLSGRDIHSSSHLIRQEYGVNENSNQCGLLSISRSSLINILYNRIKEFSNIHTQFNRKVGILNLKDDKCVIKLEDYQSDNNYSIEEFDFLIVADGVNSSIRNQFKDQLKWELKVFPLVYKDFMLSSDAVEDLNLSLSHLHLWSSKDYLLVGMPNKNRTISLLYCAHPHTNFIQRAKENICTSIGRITSIEQTNDASVPGKLSSVKLNKWFIDDKVVFIGDSAHGLFPFYGQGMNAALEDSRYLIESLEKYRFVTNKQAFMDYQTKRKPQTEILYFLSNRHYNFLKDKGKSIISRAKYNTDAFLYKLFPKLWFHEFSLMSNTNLPIDKIFLRLKIQKIISLNPAYLLLFLYFVLKENLIILSLKFNSIARKGKVSIAPASGSLLRKAQFSARSTKKNILPF